MRRIHEHRTFRGSPVLSVGVTTEMPISRDGTNKLERHAMAFKEASKEGSIERGVNINTVAISGDSTLKLVGQTSQREKVR